MWNIRQKSFEMGNWGPSRRSRLALNDESTFNKTIWNTIYEYNPIWINSSWKLKLEISTRKWPNPKWPDPMFGFSWDVENKKLDKKWPNPKRLDSMLARHESPPKNGLTRKDDNPIKTRIRIILTWTRTDYGILNSSPTRIRLTRLDQNTFQPNSPKPEWISPIRLTRLPPLRTLFDK